MQEIFGVPHYSYFDEWPHYGGGSNGTTMSTIIEMNRDSGLLLRVQQGVDQYYPVWDGPYLGGCFTLQQSRCAQCVYTTSATQQHALVGGIGGGAADATAGASSSHVSSPAARLMHSVDGQYRETMMYYYQKSKG